MTVITRSLVLLMKIKILFMKKIPFILLLVIGLSCNIKEPLEKSTVRLGYEDTIELEPGQRDWYYEVEDPGQSKLRVQISNFTDSAKKYVVSIREIEN